MILLTFLENDGAFYDVILLSFTVGLGIPTKFESAIKKYYHFFTPKNTIFIYKTLY